jgi:hypothetical protein
MTWATPTSAATAARWRRPISMAGVARGLALHAVLQHGRCCPTRAALLTGLYPHQAGVGHMMRRLGPPRLLAANLNDECVTIAEALGAAGYQTMMAGKWHVTRHVGHWSGDGQLTSKHNWPLQRGLREVLRHDPRGGSYLRSRSPSRATTSRPSRRGMILLHRRDQRPRGQVHRRRPRAASRSSSTSPTPRPIGRCTRRRRSSRSTKIATRRLGTRFVMSATSG